MIVEIIDNKVYIDNKHYGYYNGINWQIGVYLNVEIKEPIIDTIKRKVERALLETYVILKMPFKCSWGMYNNDKKLKIFGYEVDYIIANQTDYPNRSSHGILRSQLRKVLSMDVPVPHKSVN